MSYDNFIARKVCPTCRSSNTVELYSSDYLESPIRDYLVAFYSPQGGVDFEYLNDVNYTLDKCISCGLVYQRYIPNDKLMLRLYDNWINPEKALQNECNRGLEYYEWLSNDINMTIRFFLKTPNDISCLDFGMGWGEWCAMAKGYGCSAFGTELSQARINHAAKLGIPVIRWEEIPEYQFDLINANQVFEHISDPLAVFQQLGRALKPNGVIRICVPDGSDIEHRLRIMDWSVPKGSRNSLNLVAPLEHINCFAKRSLVCMAKYAGFEVARTSNNPFIGRNLLNVTPRNILRPFYRQLMRITHGDADIDLLFQRVRN